MAVRDFSVSACLSHPRIKLLSQTVHHCYMSRLMAKPTTLHVRPKNTQISLGIRPVWSESSLSTRRKLGSLASSYPLNAHRRLWSDWADSQTDLSLHWAHRHFVDSWGGSYIDVQELLLQHMFLCCNCIYKHFVETKNIVFRFFEHLLYSSFLFVIKTTVQEFEQNQCHDIIRRCFSVNNWVQKTNCTKMVSH